MRKFLYLVLVSAVLGATIKVEAVKSPAWPGWEPDLVVYDPERDVYVDHYKIPYDNCIAASASSLSTEVLDKIRQSYDGPRDIPVQHTYEFSLRDDLWRENKESVWGGMILASALPTKRRLVLINVEQSINEITNDDTTRYRVWPHLGLLFIGTAATEEGYEVVLWDELVQGYAPLEKLVELGDIVGLSLVVSGIKRGVVLAEEAKRLGARYVLAGNDSAIFRANQILSLPGRPVDAVFDSNSLWAVRDFCHQISGRPLEKITVAGVRTKPTGNLRSNRQAKLKTEQAELARARKADPRRFEQDAFLVPRLDLFPPEYWQEVWRNHNITFGHKFTGGEKLRPATALLAQGCTRTRGSCVCEYCSIAHVADIRIPERAYMHATIAAYQAFGVDHLYNVTDSVYEMAPAVARVMREAGSPFRAMFLYGRAQGVTQHPAYLDDWLSLVTERLIINMGLDSGDEQVLSQGVCKSSAQIGSRTGENRRAVELIKSSGAHLHGSFIFGSPGETKDSCERTLEFAASVAQTLGQQCDTVESDIFWLNFGSPASELFESYDYAVSLAARAGKNLSFDDWHQNFWDRRNDLAVAPETEAAWYQHFTHIEYEQARDYVVAVDNLMVQVPGSVAARGFNPAGRKQV
jgi:hypothetical protein